MPILIDTVRIANFRSLRNVEVSLTPVTVLVGMNNSGKTSFLKAINLALGGDRRLVSQDDFFVEDDPAAKAPDQIAIDVRIVPVDPTWKRLAAFEDAWLNTEFGGEIIGFEDDGRQYVALRTMVQFDNVRNEYTIERRPLATWTPFAKWKEAPVKKTRMAARFEQIPVFFMDAQRDIVSDLRSRTSYVGRLLAKVEMPPEAVQKIEEQLKALNAGIVGSSEVLAHLQSALEELSKTVPSAGTGVEITPVSKKVRDITKGLDIQFQDSAASGFPLDYHGMGTRSWASLLTYQAYVSWLSKQAEKDSDKPYHPVLALEEPEAHLHPNAQRQVYQQLRAGIGQKIISTHSPYLAAQADLTELRHFHKAGAQTEVAALVTDVLTPEDQRRIRREVLHTRGELLFARAVVLFEGETEEQALPVFARAYWGMEPFETGVVFVGVGGFGGYTPFLSTAARFRIPWFLFSDGEAQVMKNVQNQLRDVCGDMAGSASRAVFLPNGHNLEGYLIADGYVTELVAAVDSVDGQGAFEAYRRKRSGQPAGRHPTDRKCPQCRQYVYESRIRDYGGDEGAKQALHDCLADGKTKYGQAVAESVLQTSDPGRRFPARIKALLDLVSAELRLGQETAS